MNLIIVESPTKARTLSRFLGANYQIEATMGHIRDLPEKKLGVEIISKPVKQLNSKTVEGKAVTSDTVTTDYRSTDSPLHCSTEYNFVPQYEIVAKKKETIEKLKQMAGKADKIILATDPDREGEAIAWHVGQILKVPREGKVSRVPRAINSRDTRGTPDSRDTLTRIVFHEITESAIKEALANPRDIDMNLVDAQQARRVLDRLVGYKLSPLLWRKIRRGLSAGRVQSVAVRLIVEREREIEAFKPEEFWKIEAELESLRRSDLLAGRTSQGAFLATLIEKDGGKIKINNKEEADKIVSELEKLTYRVQDIKIEEGRKYPFPPFTTSTLQQAAAILFGWTSKRTMQIAQSLYEQGLITYHRTDSVNLAKQAIFAARSFIEKEYGKNYLPESPKFYKTKSKVAQEAHEAIRPTDVKLKIKNEKLKMGRDEERLYDLIWKRFVACQMREAIFEETKVEITAGVSGEEGVPQARDTRDTSHSRGTFLFLASGSRLMFEGWKKVYEQNEKLKMKNEKLTKGNGEEGEEKALPVLEVGELLKLLRLLSEQKFTQPPPRYTEATLIRALEEKGIGRPSTYAPIISTIQERQYVEKIERKFQPTVLGTTVNDFLVANFSDIVDIGFTAKMEDNLDSIAQGESQWVPVISQFYGPFERILKSVQEKAARVKVPVEETEEKCEKCGAPLVVRIGKFGKFLACSRFPECDFTKTFINKTGFTCPNCGGEVIVKKTKKGRLFYGCSNYPKCNFAAWRKPC